ncbi:ATP-binding protein [Streptomyces cyaneofuscatus]|uniref:ATP-binding protein n=1 Tax=Streptomyces cyaneofuscatus TaxID=66883 RepID=UPI0036652643
MTCLYVPPLPEAVGAARRWAAPLLPAQVRDPVVLVVSELVTNAVAADAAAGATEDNEVELVIDRAARYVALAVTDASDEPLPRTPATAPADQDCGRGLILLDALADDHGWNPRTSGGKCVWALFRCTPAQQCTTSTTERLECAHACA